MHTDPQLFLKVCVRCGGRSWLPGGWELPKGSNGESAAIMKRGSYAEAPRSARVPTALLEPSAVLPSAA